MSNESHPTTLTPPTHIDDASASQPDPKAQLLSRQLQELATKIGRLPTVNEACSEIARDRTSIGSALRTMRLEAERRDFQTATALTITVGTLTEQMDDLRQEIQRQGALVMEQGRMLEAARDSSWRHRRDLTNVRLALAVLARLTEVRELDKPRYGELVHSIHRGHFAPIGRGLSDGQEGGILSKLVGVGSIAVTIAEIAQKEQGTGGNRSLASRAQGMGRQAPAASKSEAI